MSTATQAEPIEAKAVVGELVSKPADIPIRFNVTDQKIEQIRAEVKGMTAATPKDYERVVKAIALVRTLRTSTEKTRKDLKSHALEYGRRVDAEARRIVDALESIENPLKAEKEKADAEKEKIRLAAEAAKQKLLQDRLDSLIAVEASVHPMIVQAWSDEEFKTALNGYTLAFEAKKAKAEQEAAEAARIAAEQAEALRIEQEKLAAERAELEKLRAEELARQQAEANKRRAELERIEAQQEAERAARTAEQAKIDEANRIEREKIEAEKRELEEQRRAIERAEFERQEAIRLEREAAEKAEQARIEAERLAAEADEVKRIAEVNAAIERKRLEAMRPDAEKFQAWGKSLREFVATAPTPATKEGEAFLANAVKAIKDTADHLCEGFFAS